MKQVTQSELKIGDLYCDACRINAIGAVVFRFIGEINGALNFRYIHGYCEYIMDDDGIIRLPKYKKEPNWYWKVTREMTDFYNNFNQ